jgi:hypothetical protein
MKKVVFLSFIGLILINSRLLSQRGQAVYAEVLGNGILFSFNYDLRFKNEPKGIGARIGFGYVGSPKEGGVAFIPFELNWLLGKNDRYFEVGAGATLVSSSKEVFNESFKHFVGTMTFGYRNQPSDGGFMWKIAITPILADGFFWPYFIGVGFGYAF